MFDAQSITKADYVIQGLLGDQDIGIYFPVIQSDKLLILLNTLIKSLQQYNVLITLFTQIGTDALPTSAQPRDPVTNSMRNEAQKLLKRMKSLQNKITRQDVWETPVYELLNKLIQMSDSGVYDDIFYQLYLPAKIFTEQMSFFIEYIEKNGKRVDFCNNQDDDVGITVENFHRFIRGWHSVMHLSMRADAQLVQAPGRLPILFELPAKLCEFYTAFAHRVAAFYQYDETLTPDMERAYLIVPRLSTRVSTSVVFQLGYPPQNRLIFCDLPTSMVFLISHTMVILAHEVAHFSGQATCLRGLRLERYAIVRVNIYV